MKFRPLVLLIPITFELTAFFNSFSSENLDSDTFAYSNGLVYATDYETKDPYENIIRNEWNAKPEKALTDSIKVVPLVDESRRGYSCQFNSNYEDPTDVVCRGRAEIRTERVKLNSEYTYSWSFKIPQSQMNTESINGIFGQLHSKPNLDLGEEWRSPVLSIGINKGRIYLRIVSDSRQISDSYPYVNFVSWEEEFEKGKWYNFILKIRWNYEENGDGYVKAWLSKENDFYKKITDYKGPTGYNDPEGPYLKFGIYNSSWKKGPTGVTSITAFYDDVMVSENNSHLEALIMHQNGYQNLLVTNN